VGVKRTVAPGGEKEESGENASRREKRVMGKEGKLLSGPPGGRRKNRRGRSNTNRSRGGMEGDRGAPRTFGP